MILSWSLRATENGFFVIDLSQFMKELLLIAGGKAWNLQRSSGEIFRNRIKKHKRKREKERQIDTERDKS